MYLGGGGGEGEVGEGSEGGDRGDGRGGGIVLALICRNAYLYNQGDIRVVYAPG